MKELIWKRLKQSIASLQSINDNLGRLFHSEMKTVWFTKPEGNPLRSFVIVAFSIFYLVSESQTHAQASAFAGTQMELIVTNQFDQQILTIHSPGAEGNEWGFEGGRVLKIDGVHHLFTSEMVGDPHDDAGYTLSTLTTRGL
jgi:hypothetical protein